MPDRFAGAARAAHRTRARTCRALARAATRAWRHARARHGARRRALTNALFLMVVLIKRLVVFGLRGSAYVSVTASCTTMDCVWWVGGMVVWYCVCVW